jgi:DNA-binding NarL/FixJ family response regulator
MRILVLVVDRNAIYLEGIAALIRMQSDMDLVGMANSSKAGISLYMKTRPDCTLVDMDLPLDGGIEIIQHLRSIDPAALLIGLATYELDVSGAAALAAGAAAIVAKDQVAEILPPLIRSLIRRPTY